MGFDGDQRSFCHPIYQTILRNVYTAFCNKKVVGAAEEQPRDANEYEGADDGEDDDDGEDVTTERTKEMRMRMERTARSVMQMIC